MSFSQPCLVCVCLCMCACVHTHVVHTHVRTCACVFVYILCFIGSCDMLPFALNCSTCVCSQAEEPGTAPASEKKDTKVINLEQEMLKRRKIIIHGPIDDHLAYTVCMKVYLPPPFIPSPQNMLCVFDHPTSRVFGTHPTTASLFPRSCFLRWKTLASRSK